MKIIPDPFDERDDRVIVDTAGAFVLASVQVAGVEGRTGARLVGIELEGQVLEDIKQGRA